VHVQAHTQYYNYMHEKYYSHDWSESVWSCTWALLGRKIKKNREFNFNVFLTSIICMDFMVILASLCLMMFNISCISSIITQIGSWMNLPIFYKRTASSCKSAVACVQDLTWNQYDSYHFVHHFWGDWVYWWWIMQEFTTVQVFMSLLKAMVNLPIMSA